MLGFPPGRLDEGGDDCQPITWQAGELTWGPIHLPEGVSNGGGEGARDEKRGIAQTGTPLFGRPKRFASCCFSVVVETSRFPVWSSPREVALRLVLVPEFGRGNWTTFAAALGRDVSILLIFAAYATREWLA